MSAYDLPKPGGIPSSQSAPGPKSMPWSHHMLWSHHLMAWEAAAALLLGSVVVLMALGMPVALAFLAANILGVMLFMGGVGGIGQLIANATSSVTSFILVPVPLFVLMGSLFFHSGLARRVFDTLDLCIGNLRGRLAYLTVLNGTIFAALSGSSMANTAMLGSLMVPEMRERGYRTSLAIGPILGCGGLAILIPPSTLAVLLASLGRIDVGALLIAGILPGLLLASFYILLIWLHLRLDPEAAPSYAIAKVSSLRRKLSAIAINILPMSLVVFAVIGLIILGVATPSEAAAFGVLAVLLAGLLVPLPDRRLPPKGRHGRRTHHRHDLSDPDRLLDLLTDPGLFRCDLRLRRPRRQLGSCTDRHAALHARRSSGPRHVHGSALDECC